jgi:hypothetical protein
MIYFLEFFEMFKIKILKLQNLAQPELQMTTLLLDIFNCVSHPKVDFLTKMLTSPPADDASVLVF